MKYEWRKQEKIFYLPKDKPVLVNIPKANYLCIQGKGNPNNEDFSNRVAVLYKLSYTIKMLPKKGFIPKDYYDYTVYPLEGLWNISDKGRQSQKFNKEDLLYTIMIKQPDFVNQEVLAKALDLININNSLWKDVYLKEIEDGLSVQMLHTGSYDDESISFKCMDTFLKDNHLQRKTQVHREIYLSDARKVKQDKLKTVLRYMVTGGKNNE